MSEVTLHATVDEKRLVNGVDARVTGEGRVVAAIKRMVPAHAQELKEMSNSSAATATAPATARPPGRPASGAGRHLHQPCGVF